MTLDQWISIASALMTLVGLLMVAVQIRFATRQRWMESVQGIFNTNRELLSLGFTHPKLFEILNDAPRADAEWQKRYLQLWLNHITVVHTILKHGGFDDDFREGLELDIADTLAQTNMQLHWMRVGKFYPASFQKRVNAIIAKFDRL
jgi:hypothetical protein